MTSAATFPPYPDTRPRSPGTLTLGTAHRRLDLQSPADLAHLKRAARRAARSRIDLHLPPGTADATLGGQDALQKGVEERVNVFLDTTYDGVARNTSLNGVDAETVAWDGQNEDAPEGIERAHGRVAFQLIMNNRVRTIRRAARGETRQTLCGNRGNEYIACRQAPTGCWRRSRDLAERVLTGGSITRDDVGGDRGG